MAEIIEMPKLSDTMTTGTLVKWLKKEGETVTNGDKLAEVETDKATMELENFDDGVLLKTYVEEGDQVDIGSPVCAIGEEGEEAPDVGGGSSSKPKEEEEKKEDAESGDSESKEEPSPEPSAEEPAETSTNGQEAGEDDERIKASPLARKMARDKGIRLSAVKGSGPRGRIVKADVLQAIESGTAQQSEAPSATGSTFSADPASGSFPAGEEIKLSGMRSAIARRLLESKTTIPHFYLEIEVDVAPLLAMRKSVNEGLADLAPEAGGAKFSVNDLILKASSEALRRVPAVNASWGETKIVRHGGVHLAFAVAVDDGLVTPVIRDAHAKTLRQISAEAKELAGKAKNKKLKPDEMSGSTFTVTNLGMFGINSFFGIINPPNAAILSVGATISKPVVNASGEIVVGQRMSIGISADHRVVDGAIAAQYLSALKEILEAPALMLV